MNEKPIERMKYYNGQRLEAEDLKVEQEYHIRVRRWLNKSLYSTGIAQGLEVRPDLGNSLQVIVSPGLALDHEGREIILLEEQSVKVIGKPSKPDGPVEGNYLTIQYREDTQAEESASCAPHGNGSNKGQLARGGPSRVRATPIISWSNALPHENGDKIVLAQVELSDTCEVRHVHGYVRQVVAPTSSTVRQYALEGERHIDAKNPGHIYFHIRGRQPNAVILYLRAEKFSTLFYTEMGQHIHELTLGKQIETTNPSPTMSVEAHQHDLVHIDMSSGPVATSQENNGNGHGHVLNTRIKGPHSTVTDGWIHAAVPDLANLGGSGWNANLNSVVGATISGGEHTHDLSAKASSEKIQYDHKHLITPTGSIGNAGVSDVPARSEPDPTKPQRKALKYINNLQVYIGKVDLALTEPPPPAENRTAQILTQLKNAQPAIYSSKNKLGEGSGGATDPLASNGTGAIRLDLLSNTLSFPEGDYYIELRAPEKDPVTDQAIPDNGGRILYNLYVE